MAGWLAGLDAFVVGLAYLGALLAARFVLRPLLVTVLGSAPVVGGWLASNVDRGFGDFERAILPAAEASLGTLVSALDWLVGQGAGWLGSVSDLAEGIYEYLYHLVTVTIPHDAGLAGQYLEGLIAAARGEAVGLFQGVEHDLQAGLAGASAEAASLVAQARSEALDEVNAAERVVLQEIRKAEQTTGQLFQQAEYDAQQAASAVEATAAALVQQARQDLSAGIAAAEHDIAALARATGVLIQDTTSVLGGDLAAAEARANQAIAALDEQTQKTIEGILGSLPWKSLAAGVGAGEAMLAADVKTLVGLGAAEIRKLLGDAETLRAKYGPQIQAALSQVGKGG